MSSLYVLAAGVILVLEAIRALVILMNPMDRTSTLGISNESKMGFVYNGFITCVEWRDLLVIIKSYFLM